MARESKPNIVLIMTDQHRYDRLSCVSGNMPQTPNIDRIASEGVLFTNAYTPSPVCAPARAAIKSGMYPPGCGVVGNWVPFEGDADLVTHRLGRLGYQTAVAGKLHFVPPLGRFGFEWKSLADAPYSIYAHDDQWSDYIHWLRSRGPRQDGRDVVELFDEDEAAFKTDDWGRFIMGSNFRTEGEHETAWTTDEAMRFLDERDSERPFFLYVSYFGPHQPFDVPEPWHSLYDPDDIELPPQFDADMRENPVFAATCAERASHFRQLFSPDEYRRMVAAYCGQVSMIDAHVGRLVDKLKADGMWKDSLVIFASDHGDHNGAYGLFFKGQMYDSCCKIPLLAKAPASTHQGLRRDEIVNSLDIYGTILECAGDAEWRQPGIEARSLLPLLHDNETAWQDRTYSIIGDDPATNLTMLRKGHLKLIRLARGAAGALYEMYDMRDEPVEVRDVYVDPAYRADRDRMRADLDAWWREQRVKYPSVVHSYVRGRTPRVMPKS